MADTRDQALNAFFRSPRLLRRLTHGHVNESWIVGVADRRYVLQRLNRVAFADPRVAARNFATATRLLRSRDVRTVRLRETRSGEPWFVDDAHDVWRAYGYVAGRIVRPRSVTAVHATAHAFGAFTRALSDIDSTFEPAIARFHDFGHRVRRFERAMQADRAGRGRAATRDIDRVLQLVDTVRALDEFALWGRQPGRVVHNDAKPANLVHEARRRPCVIDLDTIGPGRMGYDVGELVRSIVPEEDTAIAPLVADRIEAVWRGFTAGWRRPLESAEAAVLPIAGVMLATELATRHLADHLDGDRYFALGAGPSNQIRARIQARRAQAQLDALDDLRRRAANLLVTRP